MLKENKENEVNTGNKENVRDAEDEKYENNENNVQKSPEKKENLLGKIFQISVLQIKEMKEKEERNKLIEEVKKVSIGISKAFNLYFTAIFYQAIPASILYYPSQHVVACDLFQLQSHLSATREQGKEKELKDREMSRDERDEDNEKNDVLSRLRSSDSRMGGEFATRVPSFGAGSHFETFRQRSEEPQKSASMDSLFSKGSYMGKVGMTGTNASGNVIGGIAGLGGRINKGVKVSTERGLMQRPFSAVSEDPRDDNYDYRAREKKEKKERAEKKEKEKAEKSERAEKQKEKEKKAREDMGDSSPLEYQPFSAAQHIEEAFSHLVVDSPLFVDLLKRHGSVLHHFRF